MHYVGNRFERSRSEADWADGTVEKYRARVLGCRQRSQGD